MKKLNENNQYGNKGINNFKNIQNRIKKENQIIFEEDINDVIFPKINNDKNKNSFFENFGSNSFNKKKRYYEKTEENENDELFFNNKDNNVEDKFSPRKRKKTEA